MDQYGFRYKVKFEGEDIEQALIAPTKAHAEKALEFHKKFAEEHPEKLTLISTEVEVIDDDLELEV